MRKAFSGIVMAVLVGVLALPSSPAEAVSTPAALTIEGTAPFRDGQTVTVHGSGLTPGEQLFVYECESAGICNILVGGPLTVAQDGSVTTTATLTRYFLDYFSSYGDRPVDCATEGCRLGLIALDPEAEDGYRVVTSIPITFDQSSAWHPQVAVTPSVDLPPVATMKISGSGFAPASRAMARFCSTSNCPTTVAGTTSASGTLDLTLSVTRLGAFWDCLTEQCSVEVLDSRSVVISKTQLAFDARQVAVLPTLAATPDHDLALHDTVSVHGQNYSPGVTVLVNQCSDLATTMTWSCPSSTPATVTADGTFDVQLAVQRYVTGEFGTPVDCVIPGHCHIETNGGSVFPVVTLAPITFAEVTDDPAIHLGGVTVVEGTGPTPTVATAHVVVDRPAPAPIDVLWTTSAYEDSATTFADYGFRHDHVIIPPGATSADLTIPIVADALDEPVESFTVGINQMTNARIAPGGATATVRILDDDRPPRVNTANTIVMEGADHATVTVRLSAVSGRDVTVFYRTRRASARPGRDYVTTRGSVRVPAGAATAEIQIPIVDDTRRERTERFRVEFLGARDGQLVDGNANVWIGDDD